MESSIEGLKSRVRALEDKMATSAQGVPGFGVIPAIVGLLIVVYLVKRRK